MDGTSRNRMTSRRNARGRVGRVLANALTIAPMFLGGSAVRVARLLAQELGTPSASAEPSYAALPPVASLPIPGVVESEPKAMHYVFLWPGMRAPDGDRVPVPQLIPGTGAAGLATAASTGIVPASATQVTGGAAAPPASDSSVPSGVSRSQTGGGATSAPRAGTSAGQRTFDPRAAASNTPLRQAASVDRLGRAPQMFGDLFLSSSCAAFSETGGGFFGGATFPMSMVGQKISENNSPLPQDRFYYNFNYFDDAIHYDFSNSDFVTTSKSGARPLVRHTLGIEKTFLDQIFSLGVRVPIDQRVDVFENVGGTPMQLDVAGLGNVLVTGKTLLWSTETLAFSGGMGVEIPSGRNSVLRVGDVKIFMDNQAVHLEPFLGAIWTPSDQWFFTAFTQMDIVTNGNPVVFTSPSNLTDTQILTPPNVGHLDFMMGYWWFQGNQQSLMSGLASVLEIHYAAALQEIDTVSANFGDPIYFGCNSSSRTNGFDIVNLTTGLQANFGLSSLRLAGVFPIARDRFFDGELIVQWNRAF